MGYEKDMEIWVIYWDIQWNIKPNVGWDMGNYHQPYLIMRFNKQKLCYLLWVKKCHKPPIWEWFIPPIYKNSYLGDGLVLFYPHYWHIYIYALVN